MNTIAILRRCFLILAVASILAQPAAAYSYPLSSNAIRDAYFLGTGDPVKFSNVLEHYAKYYPAPASGQHVYQIRFETPYYLIVERIGTPFSHYNAPKAEEEFLGKPGFCRVRVEIFFGLAVHPVTPQTNYAIQLKQGQREIPIERQWKEGLMWGSERGAVENGFYLTAEYRAEDIDSESPATVEVIAPDGRNVIETFDLGSLK